MAFVSGDYEKLRAIHREVMDRFVYLTNHDPWPHTEYWQADKVMKKYANRYLVITNDSEVAVRAFLLLAREAGFFARMVVCRTPDREGHCICEVADPQLEQAYYLDTRSERITARRSLPVYEMYCASPWNPIPNDERPWVDL